uniref:WD_REPEATS_REGION domain-containing protein n=1 Tax=Gongylonema pulchrum TaxID=637853 RepID=A0A183EN13_9BILA
LTSLCVAKDRLYVGGEAGAVWVVNLPDLTLSHFHHEIDCIETLAYCSDYVIVITSSGMDGTTIHALDTDVYSACVNSTNFVVLGNFDKLRAIELDGLKELMNENVEHQSFALVPDNDALVVVDRHLLVTLFRINFNQ